MHSTKVAFITETERLWHIILVSVRVYLEWLTPFVGGYLEQRQ